MAADTSLSFDGFERITRAPIGQRAQHDGMTSPEFTTCAGLCSALLYPSQVVREGLLGKFLVFYYVR